MKGPRAPIETAACEAMGTGAGAGNMERINQENDMPKGEQRSNKMAKKPKKDTSPPKESTSDRPMPPVTTVVPKGKLKKG